MLSRPNQLPLPAEAIIKELQHSGQQAQLAAPSSSYDVECIKGQFTSPMADFLPPESSASCFFLVRPPKGENLTASDTDAAEYSRRWASLVSEGSLC